MQNNFPNSAAMLSATDAFAVVPSDTVDFDVLPQALWVGGTGDVTVALPSGNVTLKAVPAGTLVPVRAPRVMVTGTTATNIVALV
jgi:hypothetical protein